LVQTRIPLLLSGILAAALGCARLTAPNADTSPDMLLFLSRYGKFSPAEAKEIARQMERGPHDLAVQLAAARREGILLKVSSLQPALPSPERNAAPIYSRLMHLLKMKPLDPATDRVRGSLGVRVTHSAEEVAAVRRMLTERKDVMHLVHESANKLECVFRRDWTRGVLILYPENASMREAARLLSAESYFLAEQGRYRDAVANEALIFRVAQHPTSDPIAISQLVGMACDSIALAGFENILSVAGPNLAAAEAVRTTVAAHRPRFRLRRALEGEIATYSTGMNGLRRGSPAKDEAHRQLLVLYGSGKNAVPPDILQKYPPLGNPLVNQLLDANQAYYLSLMRPLVAASERPYVVDGPFLKRLQALTDTETRNPAEQLAAPELILGGMITHAVQARAQEEAIIAGAALLAYKGRHGTYPDRLEDAASTPMRDPFSTRPLKYRREGDGIVVYSVGPDGNFDGGMPGAPRDRHQAYFRYPTMPQPPQRG
jgi:hypothetical protein